MCLKKLNLLWGTDKTLFINLILLEFINSLFLWLFLTNWTLHMIENKFSTNEIAICYGITQFSRIINSIIAKYYKWYFPILISFVHIILLIPAIFSPNEFRSHVILAFFKLGDMINIYSIILGALLDKRKNIGTVDIVEYRYRFSTTIFILTWVFSYSSSLLMGGYLYQTVSFQLLLIIQFLGIIIQVVYYTILNCNGYKTNETITVNAANAANETITANAKHNWSLLDVTLVFILSIPIYGASSLLWQFMPVIYNNKFYINSFGSSIYLTLGEIIGTIFLVYKTLDNKLKVKIYCFREPRQFLLIIFLFGMFYVLLSTDIFILTVMSNIFCSFFLVILNKIHNNFIFVYSKKINLKHYQGLFMIFQCVGRLLTAISSPYLFEIYSGLPFQVYGVLLIVTSLFSFCVFKRHIYLNYADENIYWLSTSILKLEIEKQKKAIYENEKDIYESKEEITL
jgi:hypothetical protein